jgi:5-methylcytosine-specific restriction endonuclease McrA
MGRHDTLLLTQGYLPLKVISWQRAICMSFLGKVEIVTTHPDREIRTVGHSFPAPAVVRLMRAHRVGPHHIRFSRRNVYLRDRFECQYCRARFPERDLTLDHVLPRSRGGRTEWANVVACCVPCNRVKGSRTPGEAGFELLRAPRKPYWQPATAAHLGIERVPPVWEGWLSGNAGARPA